MPQSNLTWLICAACLFTRKCFNQNFFELKLNFGNKYTTTYTQFCPYTFRRESKSQLLVAYPILRQSTGIFHQYFVAYCGVLLRFYERMKALTQGTISVPLFPQKQCKMQSSFLLSLVTSIQRNPEPYLLTCCYQTFSSIQRYLLRYLVATKTEIIWAKHLKHRVPASIFNDKWLESSARSVAYRAGPVFSTLRKPRREESVVPEKIFLGAKMIQEFRMSTSSISNPVPAQCE